ncbi:hypothetical protein AZ036_003813, partial [Klebsiella michiganensis]
PGRFHGRLRRREWTHHVQD